MMPDMYSRALGRSLNSCFHHNPVKEYVRVVEGCGSGGRAATSSLLGLNLRTAQQSNTKPSMAAVLIQLQLKKHALSPFIVGNFQVRYTQRLILRHSPRLLARHLLYLIGVVQNIPILVEHPWSFGLLH